MSSDSAYKAGSTQCVPSIASESSHSEIYRVIPALNWHQSYNRGKAGNLFRLALQAHHLHQLLLYNFPVSLGIPEDRWLLACVMTGTLLPNSYLMLHSRPEFMPSAQCKFHGQASLSSFSRLCPSSSFPTFPFTQQQSGTLDQATTTT